MRCFTFRLPVITCFAASLLASLSPAFSADGGFRVSVLDFKNAQECHTLANRLSQAGLNASVIDAAKFGDAQKPLSEKIDLLIIPDADRFPANEAANLNKCISGGTHVIATGGAPFFSSPGLDVGGTHMTKKDCLGLLAKEKAVKMASVEDLSLNLKHDCDSLSRRSSLTPFKGDDDIVGIHYLADYVSNWDTWRSDNVKSFLGGGTENFIRFELKAAAGTPGACVEMVEADGSRWLATACYEGSGWTDIVLTPEMFIYWPDPKVPGRGGPTDAVNMSKVKSIKFGLSQGRGGFNSVDFKIGRNEFWLRKLCSGASPFAYNSFNYANLPVMETIAPAYKQFTLEAPCRLKTAENQMPPGFDFISKSTCVCPIQRPLGNGFGMKRPWRWIPVVNAVSDKNGGQGAPVWLLLNLGEKSKYGVFGGIGFSTEEIIGNEHLISAMIKMAMMMRTGLFLSEGGASLYTCRPGDSLSLGGTVAMYGAAEKGTRLDLHVSVSEKNGKTLFSEKLQGTALLRMNEISTSWRAPDKPGTFAVSTEFIIDGKLIDRISHELNVAEQKHARPEEFVSVSNGNFMLDGKPWYPVGINYWPSYTGGMEIGDFAGRYLTGGWLDPRFYDPELIERDLSIMAKMGINAISIQPKEAAGFYSRTYANMVDFISRCERHGLKINCYLGMADPQKLDEGSLNEFMTKNAFKDDPTIFAYDIGWEKGYVLCRDLTKYSKEWNAWVEKRYGGIANAERDWDFKAERDPNGRLQPPARRQFSMDGPWRRMVSAYRRFLNDMTSEMWMKATAAIRKYDKRHLISFRMGNAPYQSDFVITGVMKHVDFMSPEGWWTNNATTAEDMGFTTALCDYSSRGKPVFWAEFGASALKKKELFASEAGLEMEKRCHELYYANLVKSGGAGVAAWWWPGSFRNGEDSDYGILNSDMTLRPAAQSLIAFAPQMKEVRAKRKPDAWFDFDVDSDIGGLFAIKEKHGLAAYSEAMKAGKVLGVRTKGTDTNSANTPLVAVGGIPCNGHNPPKYLNAEFNFVKILDASDEWVEVCDGATVKVALGKPLKARISIGNIQEAAWLKPSEVEDGIGGVWLSSTPASPLQVSIPLPETTAYLADADFGELTLLDRINASTSVEIGMEAKGRTRFGDLRTFKIEAVR